MRNTIVSRDVAQGKDNGFQKTNAVSKLGTVEMYWQKLGWHDSRNQNEETVFYLNSYYVYSSYSYLNFLIKIISTTDIVEFKNKLN